MSVTGKWITAAAALCVILSTTARAAEPPPLQIGAIGDLTLESGEVLRDAKLGYRTEGTLNAERSNAILFPTWFTGTTAALYAAGAVATIDTSKFFLITVDAFGNGVSSSPSNNDSFNVVSRADHMVTPAPAIRFAELLGAESLLLENDCGHLATSCDGGRSTEAIRKFLE